MTRMVLSIFTDSQNATTAINELESRGYNPKDISIITKDRADAEYIHGETGSHIAEGAIGGVTTGGVLGALAGLLIGVGAIAVPGIGGILIGGPLAAALGLSGAAATTVSGAATGALAGGLIGALVGLGVPEEDARIYESRIKEGGILVAVPVRHGFEDEAINILEKSGASDIKPLVHEDLAEARRDTYEDTRPAAYFSDVGRRSKKRA